MKITQIDNRRIRRARRTLDKRTRELVKSMDLTNLYKGPNYFTWLMDRQSARIARRCGLKSFAGVPAAPKEWLDEVSWIDPNSYYPKSSPGVVADCSKCVFDIPEIAARHIRHNLTCVR